MPNSLVLKAGDGIPDPFCCSPPLHHYPQPYHPFCNRKARKELSMGPWDVDQYLGAGLQRSRGSEPVGAISCGLRLNTLGSWTREKFLQL